MASGGDDVLRIVMLGKTGAGKSSLGNTLIGKAKREEFHVGRGLKAETCKSDWKTGCRDGLTIEVVDTPGLCDTHKDEALIYREVGKSIALVSPGPHVFIFTLRCDRRFAKEEYQAYMTIKQMFSEEMKKYLILIFNGIDTYADEETETIEAQQRVLQQEIPRFGEELKQMIADAGGRYLGMKNKKATGEEKEKQANQLIAMMKQLVKENGNQYYSTSLTSKIEAQVNTLAEELAQKKTISKSRAATEVKQNIVEDNVEPGLFDWLVGVVSDGASAVTKAFSGDIPSLKKIASGGDDVLRIVMLGKTGAGKSSLGNTLIGKAKRADFLVGRGLKSETCKSDWKTGCRDGLTIEVVDTPGLCDTHKDEALIYREVGKSIALVSPGPQVLIFTLRCDRRFTKEEYQAYMTIKQMFSEEMKKYMILIFNGIDTYEDEETETIEAQQRVLQQEISRFDNELKQMIADAGGRYLGMKNKKATGEEKEKQANQLIAMMKQLVKENGNRYYSTSLTSKIEARVNKLAEELAKKKNMSKSQAATEVKQNIVKDNLEPGFFDWLGGVVSDGAAAVTEACSVM